MKEEDRNKKNALSDFERYVRGEMTKKEENAFQRKLQRDPLTDEATEGFSEISPEESAEDIDHLRKRLKNRIRGNRRVFYYSAAASIAVLMIISSVFLIVQRSKPSQQLSKGSITPVRSEVIDSTLNSEPLVAESVNETTEPVLPADAGTQTESGKKIAAGSTETTISTETVKVGFPDTTAVLAMAEKKDSDSLLVADQVAAPAAASKMAEAPGEDVPRNAMLKAVDKLGSELSKAAAAGYSTAEKAEASKPGFISAQPVTGSSNFEAYILENIRRPQSLPQGERAVAVVSFLVRSTGAIDSLKVVESPGDEFAAEAMRLIREGPAWKPAEENGQPVDNEVRLRIIFR